MREFPRGGLIGKTVHLFRGLSRLRISLYAANACYFLVLAVFPGLILLLGLLRYTPLEVERLGEMLGSILPQPLQEHAEALILTTYDNTTGATLGLSALTVLWSASRGIYGLQTGLNAVYALEEDRGWLRTRLLCVGYTFGFLLVLLATLALHVFGTGLLTFLEGLDHPIPQFLASVVDLRFFLLLFLQTAVFTAMFMALPNIRSGIWDCLPGALLASSGWLIFSDLFSVYMVRFGRLQSVYGSVYAVALCLLWLYCCMSIVFYGGVLNRVLSRGNMEQL